MLKTPLPATEQAEKRELIEHVNDDHHTEMAYILQAFCGIETVHAVTVCDVYQEGIVFSLTTPAHTEAQTQFVAFTCQGKTADKVRFLVMEAMLKLGKGKKLRHKRYFRVEKIHRHTDNMLRLTLYCPTLLPPPQAAYVCSFALQKQKRLPNPARFSATFSARLTPLLEKGYVWTVKHLPETVVRWLTPNEAVTRAYTYRHIDTANQCITVDIYLHGKTPANLWAHSLNVGDVIHSVGERGEKLHHLHSGQALLCADETALPALAGILQHWQNPTPPTVVLEISNSAEQHYLQDTDLPDQTIIVCLIRNNAQHGERIVAYLQQHAAPIDCAWGALEHHGAKKVRQLLREQHGLNGKTARISAYWRLSAASE